jgi:hypothetical protein
MSEIQSFPGSNVRAKTYYVASTIAPCQHCGLSTNLLALAVPCGHETRDPDEPDEWQLARTGAFLFHIEHLPEGVGSRLSHLSRNFRFPNGADARNSYCTNHCEHCGELLDDQELHCEMDGAFVPSSEMAAARVQLLQVQEPFEAVAHGYAVDPEFFQLVSRG